ncbi:hypothetical protein K438DRAFT_1763634 [Mycena galopus ATCC 62051]|nr:hypothetical protein K438DRAFT_1763634 [Mycena galopus ATCC 62051]
MRCAFQTQPNAVQIRARSNPTKYSVYLSAAEPNRMGYTFERGQTQPNACRFECSQTQPNAVHIRAQPNPTECGAHLSATKPNRMWCTFECGQTNPGHHAASASWGSHFCPLKTKVLLNGCPMHVMKAVNKGYTNHHGQHKSVQKWACKPAFIIWLVPGVLPSKWDNGTSHAIHNSWDVPSWMGHPPKKHPP